MRAGLFAVALLMAAGIPASAQQDNAANEADRRAMLDRLHIADTRPGADGFNAAAPNAANYDEAKVGSYTLPELMRLSDGTPVISPALWQRRRTEIVELFDREIYGRVPATAPTIHWRTVKEERTSEAGMPVVKRWLEGVADNGARPQASARIALRYTVLADQKHPLPLTLSFGFPEGFKFPGPPRAPDPGPPYTEQLLKAGFGYAVIVANSIQADSGAGLKDGVIGISLQGKPRAPDDWGVLRASMGLPANP